MSLQRALRVDGKGSQRQRWLRHQAAFLWSGATQDFVKVCISPPHISDPKLSPISPHSGPSSFPVLLMTAQVLMLTVGSPRPSMSRETGQMTGLPQGQLPGRCFKDRLPSPVSCDPNLWLCLMGFASLCIILWLFIWVKNVLPFMSEWLPPSFVHCEVFWALA